MSNRSDKLRAAAARGDASAAPVGATAAPTQTATTVKLDDRVWAGVQSWMATAKPQLGRRIGIGAVGAALYELLLDDPELQTRVIQQLT